MVWFEVVVNLFYFYFCFLKQILGVPIGCSKDQVVKAAMQLRATEIEEGYNPSVLPSRQVL